MWNIYISTKKFFFIDRNFLYIYKGDGTFDAEDYQKIARAEQIRNASDYDDFYLASKEESTVQVENAKYMVEKVLQYIECWNSRSRRETGGSFLARSIVPASRNAHICFEEERKNLLSWQIPKV